MKNLCLFLSMDAELVSDNWLMYPLKKAESRFSCLSVIRIDFPASKKPRPFPTGALDDCWFL